MSKPALACAITSAVLAATAVAHQRVGLGLSLALLLAIAAARGLTPLAGALALQPLLRDAGWVVAIDVLAAVLAAALAVARPDTWERAVRVLLAPLNLVDGTVLVGRSVAALRPAGSRVQLMPVARGLALAAMLVTTFGVLFVTADRAFADALDRTVSLRLDPSELAWRVLLAIAFAGTAGAVARAGLVTPRADAGRRVVPGRIESMIALGALVALFATFVAMQLRVLFGGAAYVRATTGLGYGDYARQGFVQLLLVAALTLGVVAIAARQRDRVVRGLLAALCLLTFVVLWSAHHRLDLVEDAYGLTRVRYAGDATVAWLAVVFALVLAAGCRQAIARRAPRIAATMTLVGVLAFSLSNPDGRIAQRAVDRAAAGHSLDRDYLAGLSADALPALEKLPAFERAIVLPPIQARLARRDGIAGFNLSRRRAR